MGKSAAGNAGWQKRKESLEVLSLIVSTVAYFIAAHYIKRYLDDMGAPPGFTRSVLTFCAAALIAYGVAFAVDWAEGLAGNDASAQHPHAGAAAFGMIARAG